MVSHFSLPNLNHPVHSFSFFQLQLSPSLQTSSLHHKTSNPSTRLASRWSIRHPNALNALVLVLPGCTFGGQPPRDHNCVLLLLAAEDKRWTVSTMVRDFEGFLGFPLYLTLADPTYRRRLLRPPPLSNMTGIGGSGRRSPPRGTTMTSCNSNPEPCPVDVMNILSMGISPRNPMRRKRYLFILIVASYPLFLQILRIFGD